MIKFGLVGCGRIAKRHSDLLGRARSTVRGWSPSATVRDRAEAIAAPFGVPAFTTWTK